ncbi:F-box/WD domain containing protein [Entamoeba histolytica HM-1:IMSS-B]|uniref:F-box WD domain containing protein n=5 Tax=Entamoeba histolytica TaxID=5759 RepID=A0A175JL92_ENTHI|nr:F-box/WD domain containing protein [Entamoeba histolytica KU27]EMH76298.1 F-box/WD domain containing protein [Entamoeba histolytica HM-1:IMSS-B]EMS16698.1 F-box/WD domain containing protein [Entamoeba histolytica HM-3:IMSS]ENY60741.1 F-box/WD domain containing protein [Entamoeba histolytica HM-1:IMSS-A]GAT94470.1 F-box WD domain containing protein [Entamoeba histolytica]
MDSLNSSILLDVSELLSTISANILLDLPVFCEDTTEPYFRAPASFLPIRERREETLQNSVPLLQLPGSIIREILKTLDAEDAVSLGRSCRQLHGIVFGVEGEKYWEDKVQEIKPSISLFQNNRKAAEIFRRCATMRKHWRQAQYTQHTIEGHMSLIKCIEIEEKKGILVTGSSDKKVKIWKINEKTLINEKVFSGQNCGIVGLSLNNDNIRIGYKNGVIKDINMVSGTAHEVVTGFQVNGFTFNEQLVLGYERTVTLLDPNKLEIIGEYRQHKRPITYSKLFNSQLGVSSSFDKTVEFWDIRNLQQTAIRLKGHHAGVNHFDFIEDKIITCSNDKSIMVWDYRKPEFPLKTLQNHTGEVIFIKHENDKIISSSKDMTLSLIDSQNFSLINTINTHSVVSSFTYDDRYLFCGCSSGELMLFDFS